MKNDIRKIIEIGCIISNTTVAEIARNLGVHKQCIYQKLYRNDMRYSDLEEICNQLGIEIKFLKDGKEL